MIAKDFRRVEGSGSRLLGFVGGVSVTLVGVRGLVAGTDVAFVACEVAVLVEMVGDFSFCTECRK